MTTQTSKFNIKLNGAPVKLHVTQYETSWQLYDLLGCYGVYVTITWKSGLWFVQIRSWNKTSYLPRTLVSHDCISIVCFVKNVLHISYRDGPIFTHNSVISCQVVLSVIPALIDKRYLRSAPQRSPIGVHQEIHQTQVRDSPFRISGNVRKYLIDYRIMPRSFLVI